MDFICVLLFCSCGIIKTFSTHALVSLGAFRHGSNLGKKSYSKFDTDLFTPLPLLPLIRDPKYKRQWQKCSRYYAQLQVSLFQPRQQEAESYHQESVMGESFWAKQRDSLEIIEYCAKMLHHDNTFSQTNVHVLSDELPLIVIHNFLPQEMCEEIINTVLETGDMKRSTLGEKQFTSSQRTSSTTWLKQNDCENPLHLFAKRASNISGIPVENMENFQVVRYRGNGEKFDLHTDHLETFNDLDCRGRLATCLLYLNSATDYNFDGSVDSNDKNDHYLLGDAAGDFFGGATWFPEYKVEIKPKCGTAVFWFNTVKRPGMNGYSPWMHLHVDLRSRHAGMPVFEKRQGGRCCHGDGIAGKRTEGEKWICNLWMHPVKIQPNQVK